MPQTGILAVSGR